jgi:hypothetical protein
VFKLGVLGPVETVGDDALADSIQYGFGRRVCIDTQ